jgi:hypothetical protein
MLPFKQSVTFLSPLSFRFITVDLVSKGTLSVERQIATPSILSPGEEYRLCRQIRLENLHPTGQTPESVDNCSAAAALTNRMSSDFHPLQFSA